MAIWLRGLLPLAFLVARSSCSEPFLDVNATLTAETVEPAAFAACVSSEVTLSVDAPADGVLHFHGLDAVMPARSMTASGSVSGLPWRAR